MPVELDQCSDDRCIIFFVKYPGEGAVKTRLAGEVKEIDVSALYEKFVLDVLVTLQGLRIPFRICYFPDSAESKIREWLGEEFAYFPQQGNDLGERMKNSFLRAFGEGFKRVIIIGSDSPDLPGQFIMDAFTSLGWAESVIGPCTDGGYYLIGFQREAFLPRVFEGIPWSTELVFRETKKILKEAGRHTCFLPTWPDIDTLQDLKELVSRGQNSTFAASHTMSFLRSKNFSE